MSNELHGDNERLDGASDVISDGAMEDSSSMKRRGGGSARVDWSKLVRVGGTTLGGGKTLDCIVCRATTGTLSSEEDE